MAQLLAPDFDFEASTIVLRWAAIVPPAQIAPSVPIYTGGILIAPPPADVADPAVGYSTSG